MARPDLSPRPGDLDPVETASRDEIVATQRERLMWTLRQRSVGKMRRVIDER